MTPSPARDISMGAAEKAVNLGIADRATAKVADAVSDADCILVAVPVLAMEGVFAEITEAMRQEAWVTDVGSTRCGVIAGGRESLGRTVLALRAGASDCWGRNARC
ncbi:MAG: prephenate dehydrogenase/arogenate dehydrogenase family protein [Duodenibacillus massiliensis]